MAATAQPFANLFGSDAPLRGVGGRSVPVSSLEGRYVLLYFSAHWCPPCRGFTPQLARFYTEQKRKRRKHNDFEVVFVSSDKNATEFAQYHASMPWPAIPFGDSRIQHIKNKFSSYVKGIPTLLVLKPDGTLQSDGGRNWVMTDGQGAKFPAEWTGMSPATSGPSLMRILFIGLLVYFAWRAGFLGGTTNTGS